MSLSHPPDPASPGVSSQAPGPDHLGMNPGGASDLNPGHRKYSIHSSYVVITVILTASPGALLKVQTSSPRPRQAGSLGIGPTQEVASLNLMSWAVGMLPSRLMGTLKALHT